MKIINKNDEITKTKNIKQSNNNENGKQYNSLYPYLNAVHGISRNEVAPLVEFVKLSDSEKIQKSRNVIIESVINCEYDPNIQFSLALSESQNLIKGYSTLDEMHRKDITDQLDQIRNYIKDPTRKRPLNILMLASPGAGKSHFIKKIAETLKVEQVRDITFNMSTMQSTDEIARPIDELRNVKVNDNFPLLFLDEFDANSTNFSLLLPLLWDGELQIGHRDLKLGRAIIFLAGSNPDLQNTMDKSANMRFEIEKNDKGLISSKFVDLTSRINGGVLTIPDLDLRTSTRDRRVDKVCISVELIRKRFGKEINEIPRSLLRFIAETSFRYGVRSIEYLIDMINIQAWKKNVLDIQNTILPMSSEKELLKSGLKLHCMDKDQGFGIVDRWNKISKDSIKIKLTEIQPNLFGIVESLIDIN